MLNIIIADDHAVVRNGLSFIIDKEPNFKVIAQAANGNQAFLEVEQNQVDILIMDLSMPPGENGLITTQRIHDHFPEVKIIILSMHEEEAYITQAFQNGVMAYVLKRSPDEELLTALNKVANNETYIDQTIILSKQSVKEMSAQENDVDMSEYSGLSNREKEILPLVVLGYANKEIASQLFISVKTVEAHKASIMKKLHTKNRAELIHYATHHGLIDF